MDAYAYLFMLIFAAALFLVAASLYFSKDPRKSMWLPGTGGSGKMSKAAAVRLARQTARGVALAAFVMTVGSVIGLIWTDYGWWVILSGVIAAVLLAFRISRQDFEPANAESEAVEEEENS